MEREAWIPICFALFVVAVLSLWNAYDIGAIQRQLNPPNSRAACRCGDSCKCDANCCCKGK